MSELNSIEAPNFVPQKPKVFSVRQAAKILGLATSSLRYHIERGNITTVRRVVPAINEAELERFRAERERWNQG